MKKVKANLFAVPVRVKVNTMDRNKSQWGQIVEAKTGKILHTGQLRHIRRVARERYNALLDI